MNEDLVLIDKYLTNQLSLDEITMFNKRVQFDSHFKAELELMNSIKGASIEIEGKRIKKFLKASDEKSILIKYKFHISLGIAASLLLFFIWQPFKSSDIDLFLEYQQYSYTHKSFDLSKRATEVLLDNGTRGLADGWSIADKEGVAVAVRAFEQREFQRTVSILGSLLNENNSKENPNLLLILSISELNIGQAREARDNLLLLNSLPNLKLKSEIEYHLAFAYLKMDDRKNAKRFFKRASESNGKLSKQANSVLRRLKWFSI